MNFLSLIEAKRDGQVLSAAQLREIMAGVAAGHLPDYQLASFLMAVFFRGLNPAETAALTLAMRDSGDVLQFPQDPRPLVDKHSTGGVGDKVSLPLAPLLACLGFRVPMISGRGLGITGGTLDKLDAIPGMQTRLSAKRIVAIVQEVGCVICGQTDRMVPADQKLYALRDVTGTVPSIPLIVASILSKKLAENLDALVLDVKFGAAAFMPTKTAARKLAKAMVQLGCRCGTNTRALLTDMNTPLGRAAGNWLEVKEAVACLTPRRAGARWDASSITADSTNTPDRLSLADLRELTLACAAHLLVQTRRARDFAAAYRRAADCLDSGQPRRKWDEMLAAQGADLDAFHRQLTRDHTAPVVVKLKATRTGFVTRCDARLWGEVIHDLGGGRLTKESVVHYDVGVDHLAKPGDAVRAGDVLARIHARSPKQAETARRRLRAAFAIAEKPGHRTPLIAEIITR